VTCSVDGSSMPAAARKQLLLSTGIKPGSTLGHIGDDLPSQSLAWCKTTQTS